MDLQKHKLTVFIKESACELGFDACGIAKAEALDMDADFFQRWLHRGCHGEMDYLERNLEKRTDPTKLVDGCKSVIVTLTNYFPAETQPENAHRISKYAYSKVDYHTTIKEKLLLLENKIKERMGENCFNSSRQHRFVDSAPVLERRWAERAGLGWIGRNKMLINPEAGSFCFIGILMINEELEYDNPIRSRCGTCRKCLDACPTNALTEKYGLMATKCISYQTIEKKGEIDDDIRAGLSGYIYGCDICNDVCPWNKTRSKISRNPDFKPAEEIVRWTESEWENLSEEEFNNVFGRSAAKRAGYAKLKQNIEILHSKKNCRKK